MSDTEDTLGKLRAQIDEIDTELHDLLIRRTEIAQQVGKAKGKGAVYLRPGREAQVLRRLVARHRGILPKAAVIRVWREIFSSATTLQGDLSIAVYAPEHDPELYTLARDHFGALTPISSYGTVSGVMRAVSDRRATAGVLPVPQSEDSENWWRHLARDFEDSPRITAKLPFTKTDASSRNRVEALTISFVPQEDTGDDRSYIIVETAEEMSRSGMRTLFANVGMETADVQTPDREPGSPMHLVEVVGYVAPDDSRLVALKEENERKIAWVWAAGGYAVPLDLGADNGGATASLKSETEILKAPAADSDAAAEPSQSA
ncbi:chorismate mutase [Pelagibius sp. Alg239-R121]|uniref:chorismate mutase n=1 Tax=Pelagibius sp. Alg239-R121 TaxID=2993448 RepID=UPI0024A6D24C|nr:chorismate mutase [Pelagibius sp. Alg239-R121]